MTYTSRMTHAPKHTLNKMHGQMLKPPQEIPYVGPCELAVERMIFASIHLED